MKTQHFFHKIIELALLQKFLLPLTICRVYIVDLSDTLRYATDFYEFNEFSCISEKQLQFQITPVVLRVNHFRSIYLLSPK